jgi:LacI family transcriptional regulator
MKNKKPTSIDVARAAGVSQSTVSMILNGKQLSSFTDETIRKVMDAAVQLGYDKVRRERAPVQGKTVAIFCPVLSNPYYSGLVQAIEQAAYAAGFRTVIHTTYRNPDIEMNHLLGLEDTVAGVIFTHIPLHSKMVETLNRQIPVVVIGDRNDMIDVDTVEVNSYRSGVAVAEHLTALGHRHIAFLSTSLNSENTIRVRRMEGVRDTVKKLGKGYSLLVKAVDVPRSADIDDPDIEHKVGYRLAQECLQVQKLTAMVCINDMVAFGAMDALLEAGKKIPQDYSICGFDNIFPSHMTAVSLTSIENHMLLKGKNAFDMLCRRINQIGTPAGADVSLTRVEYPPKLVVRDSTGPVRKDSAEQQDLAT